MKFNDKDIIVTAKDVERMIREIVSGLPTPYFRKHDYKQFEMIVAVGRGGFVPGVYLSHAMDIPLEPMMWQSRDGSQQTYVCCVEDALLEGKNIIIIDDINDTGRTFQQILKKYDKDGQYSNQITTICLVEKESSTYKCTHAGAHILSDRWVIFPWEKKA